MATRTTTILLLMAATLGACATTDQRGGNATHGRGGGSDVTRYHLGQPIAPGTIALEPQGTNTVAGPEYQLYADAVAGELAKLGFQPAPQGPESQYIAAIAFRRTPVGEVRKRPAVTIGIGGGSYGGGGIGIGGGVSTGIGGGKRSTVLATELSVQLRRRADGTTIWEGRARRQEIEGRDEPASTADILADALFRGFPGESGITISVP
ncbi:DUF4136 domain-containing protein [Sphingomonas sp.]|uniref:DUF4136 domain-containing protein n=1 Tax=Sphingomonas sp. TaxID=28214 RepID=UPI002B59540F|nr:DUF4136 domain-containing protein [Sphingomonas sp.]HWK35515.1 DUF4136 domain-containing protein [Sphingomonas sp.]